MRKKRVEELLRITKENYEKISDDFDITRRKHIWPEMKKAAAIIIDGQSVLDIGCGSGRFVRALADKKLDYFGVDNSFNMIETAKANHPERSFLIADATDLKDISDNSFDIITSFAMWHHLPGRDLQLKALDEMYRVLKPGGKAIITVWRIKEYKRLRKFIALSRFVNIITFNFSAWNDFVFPWKDSRGQVTSQRYYHNFSGTEIRNIFKKSHFSLEKMEISGGNYWIEAKKD